VPGEEAEAPGPQLALAQAVQPVADGNQAVGKYRSLPLLYILRLASGLQPLSVGARWYQR